ncbi:hypothetical protein TIFTF001_032436 [Ficus carica]|uniref:Uncharacterized protein n=1 Tax=Ficus carica TaxID=3494 RepID=A0AA88J6H6_FICCA|nr:hypothetical protein TIFTF001_032436 [Ficus carica]
MADTVESSVLHVVMDVFASPVVQKIGEVCDLGEHLKEMQSWLEAQAVVVEDDNDVGALRIQLRNDVYEAEDFLQSVAIFAAISGDDGEHGSEEGMVFQFDGVA